MKSYKSYDYYKDVNNLWIVIVNNSQFIVALDDSKIESNKQIISSRNNELTCKQFIDWIVD